jgi:hypothetical protein
MKSMNWSDGLSGNDKAEYFNGPDDDANVTSHPGKNVFDKVNFLGPDKTSFTEFEVQSMVYAAQQIGYKEGCRDVGTEVSNWKYLHDLVNANNLFKGKKLYIANALVDEIKGALTAEWDSKDAMIGFITTKITEAESSLSNIEAQHTAWMEKKGL